MSTVTRQRPYIQYPAPLFGSLYNTASAVATNVGKTAYGLPLALWKTATSRKTYTLANAANMGKSMATGAALKFMFGTALTPVLTPFGAALAAGVATAVTRGLYKSTMTNYVSGAGWKANLKSIVFSKEVGMALAFGTAGAGLVPADADLSLVGTAHAETLTSGEILERIQGQREALEAVATEVTPDPDLGVSRADVFADAMNNSEAAAEAERIAAEEAAAEAERIAAEEAAAEAERIAAEEAAAEAERIAAEEAAAEAERIAAEEAAAEAERIAAEEAARIAAEAIAEEIAAAQAEIAEQAAADLAAQEAARIAAEEAAAAAAFEAAKAVNIIDAGILLDGVAANDMDLVQQFINTANDIGGIDADLIDAVQAKMVDADFVMSADSVRAVTAYSESLTASLEDGTLTNAEYRNALGTMFEQLADPETNFVTDVANQLDDTKLYDRSTQSDALEKMANAMKLAA